MRGACRVLAVLLCLAAASVYALSGSKFHQRTAAFGFGSVGSGVPVGSVLQPVGTGISDHPLFESLYIGEPDRVVATCRYGKVTARDLYLFLVLTRSKISPYILEVFDKTKSPSEKEELAKQIRRAIEDYVFVNHIVPRLVAGEPFNEIDEARAQVTALEAYRFVYVANLERSKIKLTDADRVKYLQEHRTEIAQPERWRVRYIFMRSEETDPLDKQDEVQKRMEDLRRDILRGKIDFPEAARKFSEAPSAAQGGEVPPFKRGEFFYYLEDAVSRLQPGELSEVIRGPHGFYLVQLIEVLPPEELSLDNPVQAGKVEDGLTRQVLRAQYLWDLKVLLEEKRRPIYNIRPWDEKKLEDVVGEVAGFTITKGQLLNIFPSLESHELVSQEQSAEYTLKRILEGEAIAQEIRGTELENSPYLQPMLEMARNVARVEKLKEKLSCELRPSRSTVFQFWKNNPELFTPLPMKRIIEVTLTPLNTASVPEQTVAELERALAEGGGEAPSPLQPRGAAGYSLPSSPEFAEELTSATAQAGAKTDVNTSRSEEERSFSSKDSDSTHSASEELTSGSLRGGGAGQDSPTVGGVSPKTKKSKQAEKQKPAYDNGTGTWHGPLEFVGQETPASGTNTPVQKMPPVHARTITPTRLREVVANYRSADWQLAYRDLGYVYVEDMPELPPELSQTPTGSYLPPKYKDGRAVTYVVEDTKRFPKPSFNEIEAYAYYVWQEVQVEKKFREIREKELSGAELKLSLEK